jgi:hypothetical protein
VRPNIVIPGFVLFCLAMGLWIEEAQLFATARMVMRDDAVPSGALETGPLAKILSTNGMLYSALQDDGLEVFRLSTNSLDFGDSEALAQGHLHESWPLVSVTVNPENLTANERGIFANFNQRWEVPAQVTYFEGGELVGKADCGLRLHGNSTRAPEVREKHGASVRLYFRETYGSGALPQTQILGPDIPDDAHLIIRGESSLSSALSFDIVRQVGGDAPNMRPALYVLNGELQGMFSLSEHLTKDMWGLRLGHNDFAFYRNRGSNSKPDKANYEDFHAWIRDLPPGQCTVERVSENVDLENFVRHIFPILWCGTDDWAQGAAYLDRGPNFRHWRWVNWDMDRSFRHSAGDRMGPTWNKLCFEQILGDLSARPDATEEMIESNKLQTSDVRGLIFGGLVRNDGAFRDYFAELAMGFMNHELNAAFFADRFTYYRQFVGSPGISHTALKDVDTFLRKRSEFFREDMARAFGLAPSFPVEVLAPKNTKDFQFLIDGRLESAPYRGYYFAGQTIAIALPDQEAPQLWKVGAETVSATTLEYQLNSSIRIRLQ